eukprot:758573-Hanusia_phi.AAC.8
MMFLIAQTCFNISLTVQAGVGIFFQQENDGSVYVKTIVSGGSAEREGSVRVGDMILAVDDRDVIGEPLSTLRGLILGPQGSRVRLTFERREGAENYRYESTLIRGTAEYLNGISPTRSMDDDIDDELKKRHEEEKNRLEQLFLKEQAGRREDQVLRLSAESNLSKVQAELSRLREYELARKELEEECKTKIEDENTRMKEIFQVSDQMRMTLRDIELKMSRAYGDYFNIAPYESAVENEAEDAEDLFLA